MKAKLFLLLLIGNSVSAQVVDVFSNLNSAGVSNLTNCDTYIYFNSYTQKKYTVLIILLKILSMNLFIRLMKVPILFM